MPRRATPLLALAALAALSAQSAAEELVDGIAAQVGSDIVLVSEVLRMVEPMEARMRQAGASQVEIAKLRADGLERMIEWRLIERVVRDAELFATEAEIDEAIDGIAAENGLSLEQLRASVSSHGLSYADYRAQLKRELERRKVLNAMVRSQVRVEDEDVRSLYLRRFADQPEDGTQVHLRQVLLTYGGESGRSKEVACSLVRKGLQRVRDGQDFAAVASDLSEVSPETGGDLGWLMEDSLAAWMKDIVKSLEPGETSDLSELPFGCVLLNLVERKEYVPVTFEAARAQLTEEVFQQAMAEAYAEWLEKLRSQTFIERRGYFADAAVFSQPTLYDSYTAPPETPGSSPDS